jgi:hypothetical protein
MTNEEIMSAVEAAFRDATATPFSVETMFDEIDDVFIRADFANGTMHWSPSDRWMPREQIEASMLKVMAGAFGHAIDRHHASTTTPTV